MHAGFFCFGSPYELPGRAAQDRGLLNLELGGSLGLGLGIDRRSYGQHPRFDLRSNVRGGQ